MATSRRVSTCELATLDALVQYCLETPAPHDSVLRVPVRDLASRVVEAYWPQMRVFGEHGVLRQNEQSHAGTVTVVDTVRWLPSGVERRGLFPVDQFEEAAPQESATTIRRLSITLAQQPLFALQRTGGRAPRTAFL